MAKLKEHHILGAEELANHKSIRDIRHSAGRGADPLADLHPEVVDVTLHDRVAAFVTKIFRRGQEALHVGAGGTLALSQKRTAGKTDGLVVDVAHREIAS